nr:integrase, catalytic region, zinc finger, CCHC-type, peptidase aspartic, catalytic [Tanacetum cinerariifolium]
MLNKDNYVSWPSRIIWYARSKPNGKMIVDPIENGPYLRRMIATTGEPYLPVPFPKTFHKQTDEELIESDIKRMHADDQAIQTIFLGLPKDVYAVVDSCEIAKEIWKRVRQLMKGSDIQEKKAKLFNEWEKFTSTDGGSIESYYHHIMQLMNDLKRHKHFPDNIAANLKFLNNLQPEWKRHVTINGGNQNGLVVVPGIANQNGTGNIVTVRAKARPRRRDAAYFHTQPLIAQKEEAEIQLQVQEFDFMAVAGDLDEIEEVNANCILMANLQHASTSGTQLNKAPVYDTNGSAEVQPNDNCYDNEIFNMFTQEEQYMDLLEPIPKPQLVLQNDNHVFSVALTMVQSGGTVETSSAPNEETRAHQETVHRVFVPQTTKSKEELFLPNVSNMVIISKMISIPNEYLLDDTTPSVARKFLNEVKNSLVTLQRVVKQKMTLEVHNWSSSAHKEVHKIISHEITSIINQVDARVQNFEIQFLQAAAKFVQEFKSLAKEADESLDKQKSLELEIERLLKASVSHDIMSIVENGFVDVPSDLQTELDRTKEKLEHCILKKEKEYIVSWDNWYTKYEECKYDKISYDKAYNDMQQKVKRLQAQLGDLKGKSSDTPRTSVTPQVDKPKLIAVTPYSKKLHASIPSHSVPQPREFDVVKHSNVIAPGMFKIDPSQTSRENMSSDMVNSSSTGLVHIARNRRPQPKGNTRNDKVPSASKSSEAKKNVIIEDHRRNLSLSKNQKTMSSERNNIKLAIWNDKSKIICGTCCPNLFVVRQLGLFQAYDWEHQASHQLCVEVFRNCSLWERPHCCNYKIWRNTCFIRDLDGVDLLKGYRSINLYTINLYDMTSASPICLMARATPTKSWLWNQLVYPTSTSTPSKTLPKMSSSLVYQSLNMLKNMFIPLVSREKAKEPPTHPNMFWIQNSGFISFIWICVVQCELQALMVGMTHETSTAKTPQQNRVIERRNHTLVEAARTMLIFSHAPLFLWAEAIANACYTQNHTI